MHSFYSSATPSGENAVVMDQLRMLEEAGHEVLLVGRHTDDNGPADTVRAAVSVATGAGPDPTEQLARFAPDVVHVHNLFPNFGTRWLARWRGPIVATLHNYRPMCANGLFLRDDRNCTLCPDAGVHNAVKHRCYRGSVVATLPLAIRNRRGLLHDAVVARADRVIVLSPRSYDIYRTYGVPLDRLRLIPNGLWGGAVEEPLALTRLARPGSGWVSVGRLAPEKGFVDLMRWWPRGERLTVFGDGPQRREVEVAAGPDVTVAGQLTPSEIRSRFREYEGAVFGGTAWEGGIPMTVLESLAMGTPIVARAGGAAAMAVEHFGCGVVYNTPGELARALQDIRANRSVYRTAALIAFRAHFRADTWLGHLVDLYGDVVSRRDA